MSYLYRPYIRAAAVVCLAFCFLAVSSPLHAGLVYDEAVDGDLSDDNTNPTPLSISLGSNTLNYNVVNDSNGTDLDYFTFNVPAGQALSAIHLTDFDNVDFDAAAFLAILEGSTFDVTVGEAYLDPGSLLGYSHIGPAQFGDNLLENWGLSTPLPAGDYSFWTQQTGSSTDITLDFVTTPEPASFALLAAGAIACLPRRRRA